MTPTPSELERKTIWFTPYVWRALNSLMRIKGDDSPSLTVERLVRDAYDKIKHTKGTENGRTAVAG